MALIDKLTAIANAIRGKTGKTAELTLDQMATEISGIETGGNYQAKTATPLTSAQTIKPDSGYDALSEVTVNAMPAAEQATPSISVSSAGLITASAAQSAGYVAEGTKSATKQLSTQAAKTVTPGTSNQTAVASGKYTTGAITVKGDANLKAANILKGVSIFGVAGSLPKVATGTFTGTSGLKSNPISVTGLGFTPTRVIAYLDYSHDYNLGSIDVIVAIDGNGTTTKVTHNIQVSYCDSCEEYSYGLKTQSDTAVSMTMFSGGFTILSSSNSSPYLCDEETYQYIALG